MMFHYWENVEGELSVSPSNLFGEENPPSGHTEARDS